MTFMASKEGRIVRYTAEEIDAMLARGESKSDWARVDAMTEEELEASIDFEEEGEIDWDNLEVTLAPSSRAPLVHVDGDLLDWFRKKGPGYQIRINQVLRSYVEAQREKETKDRKAS